MDTERYKPEGLSGHAELFWQDVTEGYDLRLDELIVLGNACKEIDLIERLTGGSAHRELIAKGYNGQDVADPLITEVRQHRTTLANLIKQLKLPDDEGARKSGQETRAEASEKARMAANTRWRRVREAG